MKQLYTFVLAAALLIGAFSAAFAQEQNLNFVPNQLIVMVAHKQKAEAVVTAFNDAFPDANVRIKQTLVPRINIHLLEFDANALHYHDALRFAKDHPLVDIAQLNHTDVVLRATEPDDPRYVSGDQWDMNNNGSGGGTADADIDAEEAWDITTGGLTGRGDTIVVAVIDGGFDIQHEDLNFWKNNAEIPGNFIDDDNNGYIDDYDGWNAYNDNGNVTSSTHGTHVSGTVGAIGNNGIGVAGVNWNVEVMAIQGSSGQEATVVAAYGFALEHRARYNETNGAEGAFVVATNSSFGVDFGDPPNYPIWCAFYDSLGAAGILSAGATANQNLDIDVEGDIPTACASDYMIAVTNMNRNDQKVNSAAYGATTIDLGAPGDGIWSTVPGNQYSGTQSGTSMATPHVAGAVGLMYSATCESMFEDNTPSELALLMRDYLLNGVDPLNNLSGITVTGGRLNLFNSVQAVADYTCGVGLEFAVTNAGCASCDGQATAMPVGGDAPYTYQWDAQAGGGTNATATGLCVGNYAVTITDGNGDVGTETVVVGSTGGPVISTIVADVTCYGDDDGSANANVTSGNAPYTWQWETGGTGNWEGGLSAGSTYVTITDNLGCSSIAEVMVSQPQQITVTANLTHPHPGVANGIIDISVSGGVGNFTYSWTNGATSADLAGLPNGTYFLQVTDGNGCSRSFSFMLDDALGIDLQTNWNNLAIFPNPSDGAFTIAFPTVKGAQTVQVTNVLGAVVAIKTFTGLTPGAQVQLDLSGQPAGAYFFTVRSAHEVTATRMLVINR